MAWQQFIEWRRTFAPPDRLKGMSFVAQPTLLDELYSRELLRSVPGVVERTRALQAMVFPDATNAVWFIFLRESAQCFIAGLPQASIALARAALESRLKELCAKAFGKSVAERAGLDVLINEYGPRMKVSPAILQKAAKVRVAAKKVLHGEPSESESARVVLEDVRTLLLSLSGK
jgi:hypothetical protein